MTKRRVVLHALRLLEGRHKTPEGNFHHIQQFAPALCQATEGSPYELKILVDEDVHASFVDLVPKECLVLASGGGRSVWHADCAVKRYVRESEAAIYHRPTGQLPLGYLPCKTVAGVADLNFRWLKMPIAKRLYKELSYRWTFRTADRVVCISEFTKRDVIEKMRIDPRKLAVISHGLNVLPAPERVDDLDADFWLTFGHQERKNVQACFAAMVRMKAEGRLKWKLVVVGKSHYTENTLKPLAISAGLASDVVFAGKVSGAQLHWLYKKAIGLLFMSRFEGFGMPIVEAMGIGCPVICTSVCSLAEVGGGAVRYADSVEELYLAIREFGENACLRMQYTQMGHERAKLFSWARAATETIRLYSEILSTAKP